MSQGSEICRGYSSRSCSQMAAWPRWISFLVTRPFYQGQLAGKPVLADSCLLFCQPQTPAACNLRTCWQEHAVSGSSCAPSCVWCNLADGCPCCRYVGYALTTKWQGCPSRQQIIGFDMGGTSTDVSRFAGTYEHVFESTTAGQLTSTDCPCQAECNFMSFWLLTCNRRILRLHSPLEVLSCPCCSGTPRVHWPAGVTIQAPQLDINTVAAGGGSCLTFSAGVFKVGPESAGAHPGPVCYR